MTYDTEHAMRSKPVTGLPEHPEKGGNRTVTEIIANHEKQIADAKALAKRFPEAYRRDGEWVSPGINGSSAKHFKVLFAGDCIFLHFHAVVKTKDGNIKVFGEKNYEITQAHVAEVLESNPRVVLKTLKRVFNCQE